MKKTAFMILVVLLAVALMAQTGKPLSGYEVMVVQKFEVDLPAPNSSLPVGYDGVLQKTTYSRLASSRIFPTVIDGTEAPPTISSTDAPEAQKKILLAGTVIGYDKGSRTARWMIGMGAGSSRIQVRFVATDAATGQELWRTEQEGTFAGTFQIGGGSESKAVNESTRKVAENLVKQIKLAR